jgi:hypothetical protein
VHKFGDIGIAIVYLAVIFVLVRPGSQGPGLVKSLGDSFTGALKAATGGGTWSGK